MRMNTEIITRLQAQKISIPDYAKYGIFGDNLSGVWGWGNTADEALRHALMNLRHAYQQDAEIALDEKIASGYIESYSQDDIDSSLLVGTWFVEVVDK